VFFGKERFVHSANAGFAPDHANEDAHGSTDNHAHGPVTPHESPWPMVLPLVVLAGLTIVGGGLNLPFSTATEKLALWLESAKIPGGELSAFVGEQAHTAGGTKLFLAAIAVACGFAGIAIGWTKWGKGDPADSAKLELPLLKKAYGVDALYSAAIVAPGEALSNQLASTVDRKGIDGIVNGVGRLVRAGSTQLRRLQTGYVRNYALGVIGGIVAMLAWAVYRAGV
jgi:NADH-quinone oxidoreductase subunit L